MAALLTWLLTLFMSTTPFTETFSNGIDPTKWQVSTWGAPGTALGVNKGSFSANNVFLTQGVLTLKLEQHPDPAGGVDSIGGEITSKDVYGYGTYTFVARAGSTCPAPVGSGRAISGGITGLFNYVNNSQTEIDFEVEGDHPTKLWLTNWLTTGAKQSTFGTMQAPENGFNTYVFVWRAGSIVFWVNGVQVGVHTQNVPTAPAHIILNHWGTNSTGWGGLATPGTDRFMYIKSVSYKP